jgi:hypothetical protein
VGNLYEETIPKEATIGEVGQVITLTHVPQTVMLDRTYVEPVVFPQDYLFVPNRCRT